METFSHYRLNLYNVSFSCCQPSFPSDILVLHVLGLLLLSGLNFLTWNLTYYSVSPHPSGVTALGFISDLPLPLQEVNFGVTLSQEQQKGWEES